MEACQRILGKIDDMRREEKWEMICSLEKVVREKRSFLQYNLVTMDMAPNWCYRTNGAHMMPNRGQPSRKRLLFYQ